MPDLPTGFKLNTGAFMPAVGLGTWQSEPGKVAAAVKAAVNAGYKHIDGAYIYGNEKEIGTALQELFKEGKIKREELFYTSKLWNTFHRPEKVAENLNQTLKDLQLDYLDLYLMHWPIAFQPGGDSFPRNDKGKVITDDVDFVTTYKEMEKLYDSGKVKAIGVSNFPISHLKKLLPETRIKPAVLQVELHPYLPQTALLEFCQKEGIVMTAYSPLGSGNEKSPLKDETVVSIAKKHNKDPGQIILSWAVQRGTVVIPKSVKPERIESNFKLEALSDEEEKQISGLKTRFRVVDVDDGWGVKLFQGDFADK